VAKRVANEHEGPEGKKRTGTRKDKEKGSLKDQKATDAAIQEAALKKPALDPVRAPCTHGQQV
jgi:hypothetical protein